MYTSTAMRSTPMKPRSASTAGLRRWINVVGLRRHRRAQHGQVLHGPGVAHRVEVGAAAAQCDPRIRRRREPPHDVLARVRCDEEVREWIGEMWIGAGLGHEN